MSPSHIHKADRSSTLLDFTLQYRALRLHHLRFHDTGFRQEQPCVQRVPVGDLLRVFFLYHDHQGYLPGWISCEDVELQSSGVGRFPSIVMSTIWCDGGVAVVAIFVRPCESGRVCLSGNSSVDDGGDAAKKEDS